MKHARHLFATILIFVLILTLHGSIKAEKFFVKGAAETDSVIFESEAKLEFVQGMTNHIKGVIEFDPGNTVTATGHIRVEAATLKTGIDLRDQHMRDHHLETDKYPYIEFVLKSVTGLPAALELGKSYDCKVVGDFTLHGSTKPITAPASVVFVSKGSENPEKILQVVATFPVKLDDYGVPRPKALFLKLAEQMNIRVIFSASTAYPPVEFK